MPKIYRVRWDGNAGEYITRNEGHSVTDNPRLTLAEARAEAKRLNEREREMKK